MQLQVFLAITKVFHQSISQSMHNDIGLYIAIYQVYKSSPYYYIILLVDKLYTLYTIVPYVTSYLVHKPGLWSRSRHLGLETY